MRFLLYLNLIAIVLLAGALARLYDGAPLPWLNGPAQAEGEGQGDSAGEDRVAARDASPVPPSAPLTIGQIMALQLPLPNPVRAVAPADAPAPQAVRTLRLLTEGDYPPFNYRDRAGTLAGFDVELAQALCARLNAECMFETRRWEELLPALKRGEGDAVVASMLIPGPGRESPSPDEAVVFTSSYYSTPGHFAARKDAAPLAASPAALAGKRVGVQAGSVHQAFALTRFSGAEVVKHETLADAEAALAQGRVDLLFADRNALLRWTSKEGGMCCRLVGPDYADPVFFGKGAGIALRADDGGALRARFDAALSALVADGTYARISARYFSASIY
ncbi:MAG: transporter substrate-binding domain-containing protein [Parvibaculum sp.]|nr:transporter substrate-binding domain-containing protein [Parvibaculum sp.]